MELLEIRALQAFVAAVEDGSLSGAARRMHMSQPALSQIIRRLEKRLNCPLLIRGSGGVSASHAGITLFRESQILIARHEQTASLMSRHSTAHDEALRVGIPLELPPTLLTPALALLALASPAIEVNVRHLSTARQTEMLLSNDLELGLIRELPAGLTLDTQLVLEEPLGVLMAAADARILEADTGIALDALTGLKWLGFPPRCSPAWHDELAAILRSHGHRLTASPSEAQDSILEVKVAVISSGGTFALASAEWTPRLPDPVVWRPLTGSPVRRRTWAAWSADSCRRDLGLLVGALEGCGAAREEESRTPPSDLALNECREDSGRDLSG